MTAPEKNILSILGYFDLFGYPLRADEIYASMQSEVVRYDMDHALTSLLNTGRIFLLDEFYSIRNDMQLAENRKAGNARALAQMQVAVRSASRIAGFPYVRAVAISGSLSKNFADDKTDIDFFIITAPGRLWVARTFLHLFKKLSFLVGHQHRYCMNYFVDEAGMEIGEKNIFTAMEIVTLIPMAGPEVLKNFSLINQWTTDYFPFRAIPAERATLQRGRVVPGIIERLLNGAFGNWLDNCLMRITDKRWKRKAERRQVNSRGIVMSMIAGKHFSKPDPVNFQEKILRRYAEKMEGLLHREAVMAGGAGVNS